jgi:hypothetical protein
MLTCLATITGITVAIARRKAKPMVAAIQRAYSNNTIWAIPLIIFAMTHSINALPSTRAIARASY